MCVVLADCHGKTQTRKVRLAWRGATLMYIFISLSFTAGSLPVALAGGSCVPAYNFVSQLDDTSLQGTEDGGLKPSTELTQNSSV